MSKMFMLPEIYLASSSPRRQELMRLVCPHFRVVRHRKDVENLVQFGGDPAEYARRIAEKKALHSDVVQSENAILLAFDTVVYVDGRILGKPRSEDEARIFLKMLSGKWHSVYTGVSAVLMPDGRMVSDVEKTDVLFSHLSEKEIEQYIASGEPMDKAGAYGIQGLGSLFVERISGCYYNVVGLPLFRLTQVLERLNFRRELLLNLWRTQ